MKLFLRLFVGFICLSSVVQADEKLTRQVHQQFIDDYIVKHLQNFKSQSQTLDVTVIDACTTSSDANWQAVKTQYISAASAWMPLQSLRFGAFEKNSRDLRIYFWPNSRGEKQAGKFLTKMDASKLETSYFPNISVALQGLPIIEWLLYHPDSPLYADDAASSAYTCKFIQAITNNLQTVNDELIAEFSQGGAMREALLNPSDSNDFYNSLPEVTLQLYKNIHAMVELVHGQKLSRPIAKEFKYLKPKRLEMWRSGQSKQNLTANIANIYQAYKIFSPLVKNGEADSQTDKLVRQQFEQSLAQINALPDDFYAAFNGEARAQTWQQGRDLIAQIEILKTSLADKVTTALDIPLGFNSLDGD